MSYHFGSFGQAPPQQDPYDLSVCWPQYREEGDKIVNDIRAGIARVAPTRPANARILDEELKELIQKFRSSNACPNLSDGNHMYTDDLKQLIERVNAAAQEAAVAGQEIQQMQVQHAQGSQTTMVIIAVAVAVLSIAIIGAVILVVKKSGKPQFAELVQDQAQ